MTTLPATVTIFDLATTTSLPSSAMLEAQFTSAGVATTVQASLSQILSTVLTTVLQGTTGLPIVGNGTASLASFQVLGVIGGGSGATTLTPFGSLYGNGTSAIGVTPAGTAFWPLLGNGSALAPSFQQLNLTASITGVLSVPFGGTNTSTLTSFGVVFGRGTSTIGITAAGTAGWPLVGNGTSVAPAFAQPTGTGSPVLANAPTLGSTVTISNNATTAPAGVAGTILELAGVDGTTTSLTLDSFGAGVSTYYGRRARGANAAPTALQAADPIIAFAAAGYDGSAYSGAQASISVDAPTNWSTGSHPARISFNVTPIGTTTVITGARVAEDGGITVPPTVAGTSKGLGTINVSSGFYLNGTAIFPSTFGTTAWPLVANGTVLAPSFQVLSVPGGGTNTTTLTAFGALYGNGTSTIGVTAAGTTLFALLGNGTSLAPSFQQVSLTGSVTGVLGVPFGGTNTSTLTLNGVVFGNGSSTVGITAAGTTAWALLGNGTSLAPTFQQVNLTTSVTGVLGVPFGGTNTSTLTQNGVLFGNAATTVGITAAGATASILVNAAGAAPSFTTAPVIGTSVTVPVVIGGTLTTSPLTFRPTSAAGATSADLIFQVGNNGATEAMRIVNAGQVGVGVTPSTSWGTATYKVVQLNTINAFGGSNAALTVFQNLVFDDTNFLYSSTSSASLQILTGGEFQWYTSPSGTAGATATITQRLRLLNSGGLIIGSAGSDPGAGNVKANGIATLLSQTGLTTVGATAVLFSSVSGFGIFIGTGVPSITAGTGSIFLRNDGATATTRMYINTNGGTTWTGVTTVA